MGMLAVVVMKYLQILGTVMCLLLVVIAVELHGLQPIRQGDLARLEKLHDGKQIVELYSRLPLVRVQGVVGITTDQAIDVRIDR